MKKIIFIAVAMIFFFQDPTLRASSPPKSEPPERKGEVSLPWDEFQRILRLGTGDIQLEIEEFIALLRQTSAKEFPPFVVKGGEVILARKDFKKLLDSMKSPIDKHSLGDYLVTRASYRATVEQDTTLVQADFSIEVLTPQHVKKYIVIPLLRQEIALRDINLNGKPAIVTTQKGHHAVAISEPGSHTVNLSFNVQTDLKRGPQSISFPIPKTPITLLSMEIPIPSIKPEITSAMAIKSKTNQKTTQVEAILSPTQRIQITWSRVIPEDEKGPAKIYTDIYQLMSIEDDALRIWTTKIP
jgi:hypothetical protein